MARIRPFVVLPPLAALLVVGIGYGFQRHTVRTVEQENEVLRKEIQAARLGHDGTGTSSLSESVRQKKEETRGKGLDWKILALRMRESEGGGPSRLREILALQQSMQEMPVKDLVAALKEIQALDLPEKSKQQLEYFLVDALLEKDPKQTLELLADRLQDPKGAMPWRLSIAFQKWTEKDQGAAIAWLDLQIQDGKFDAKSLDGANPNLVRFEVNLVRSLLGSDPTAADQRLTAMGEKDRLALFQQVSAHNLKPDTAKSYAELVRKHLPIEDQLAQFGAAAQVMVLGDGDYGRVEKFMGDIAATNAERNAIVERAVQDKLLHSNRTGNLSTNIEEARAWAIKQSPAEADAITGNALGKLADKNFEEASKLALQYHETAGNDDVLVRFIGSQPMPTNKEELFPMVERIRDPQKREELRNKLRGANQEK